MHAQEFSELRSCVEVEVAVLSLPYLLVLMVSVDVKQHYNSPQYNNPLLILKKEIQLFFEFIEAQSSGTVKVTALGSPSLIILMVSVDVKQHYNPPQYSNTLLILQKEIQLFVEFTEAQST